MAAEYLNLHVGKLTQDASTKLTIRAEAAFSEKAYAAGYSPSEILRELVHFYISGETFTEAKAKDIRASFASEALSQYHIRGLS